MKSKKSELTTENWDTFYKLIRKADNVDLEAMNDELVKERRIR